MTAEELEKLRSELRQLETEGRREMASRIKTAREWGDLKENAEYHAAKEQQAHLETRILRLREQLRRASVEDALLHPDRRELRWNRTDTPRCSLALPAHCTSPVRGDR